MDEEQVINLIQNMNAVELLSLYAAGNYLEDNCEVPVAIKSQLEALGSQLDQIKAEAIKHYVNKCNADAHKHVQFRQTESTRKYHSTMPSSSAEPELQTMRTPKPVNTFIPINARSSVSASISLNMSATAR